MSLRVLVAPDKFKGTLTALQAANAMVNGWWSARPADEMEILPISDGGDGFGEIIANLMGAGVETCVTVDAANRPLQADWWWDPESQTAIIESAKVVGLAMLPTGRYHPFDLDTRGLAPVLQAAIAAGARSILIGIGGSATNDAGFGLATSLGWQFLDERQRPIDRWPKLNTLTEWLPPAVVLPDVEITVAVDVENPLLGVNGCSRVYGPQKGLQSQQAPIAEAALEKLAAQARSQLGVDLAAEPGSGAAGGLGFGLMAFTGARLKSGFEIFARLAQLDERIAAADLILTGEGMIDRQSLMGKGTGRLAQRCRDLGKRCIGFGGMVDGAAKARTPDRLFYSAHDLAPGLTSPTEAKKDAALWLQRLAAKVASEYD
jgi:glycerate kinase